MGSVMQLGLALGLAGAAGMRAYFPLILMGMATRFSDTLAYGQPFKLLASLPFIVLVLLLALYEIGGSRLIGMDGDQVVLLVGLRALAGGMLFAGVFRGFGTLFGLLAGAALAVVSYIILVKVSSREGTVGAYERGQIQGDGFRPVFEEAVSVTVTILSILLPWSSYLIWGLLIFFFIKRFKDRAYIREPRMRVWR